MNADDRQLMECYAAEFATLRTLLQEHVKQGEAFRAELKQDMTRIRHTLRGNGGKGLCSRMDAVESRVKWVWGLFTAAILAVIGAFASK